MQAPMTDLYVVSLRKFYILFMFTLGGYTVYWFYRNWQAQKQATNADIWPVMRGLFCIFFTTSLFRAVAEKLKSRNLSYPWTPDALAAVFIVLLVADRVLGRLSDEGVGSPLTDYLSIAVIPLIGFTLGRAQPPINLACDDPEGMSNDALTGANWAWVVVGACLWVLILIGLFAPG